MSNQSFYSSSCNPKQIIIRLKTYSIPRGSSINFLNFCSYDSNYSKNMPGKLNNDEF